MKRALVVAAILLVALAAAFALVPKDEQDCLKALNKAGAKVASAQGKENARCLKLATIHQLPPGVDADGCPAADLRGKVAVLAAKTLTANSHACSATLPSFGYTGGSNVNTAAVGHEQALMTDIFGSSLTTGVIDGSIDHAGAACQSKAVTLAEKLLDTSSKEFVRCKTKGLAAGTIHDGVDLGACVGADPGQKIARALTKLRDGITGGCSGVDLHHAFPGSCSLAADVPTCVGQRVACRACLMLGAMDDLAADCDALDDGVANGSCPAPGLPVAVHQAIDALRAAVPVTSASRVTVIGPVAADTTMREGRPENQGTPVELHVPAAPATYYAFFIDDAPQNRFAHAVRYAWVSLPSGDHAVVDAEWKPYVLQPGEPCDPVVVLGTDTVTGVPYNWGKGCGGGYRYAEKPTISITLGPLPTTTPTLSVSPSPGPTCTSSPVRAAVVIDGGADDITAGTLSRDARNMSTYLTDKGFGVHRVSQDKNDKSALALPFKAGDPDTMQNALRDQILDVCGKLPCGCPGCSECFIYITAHGNTDTTTPHTIGYFTMYDSRGSGASQSVDYPLLDAWLFRVNACVKLIIMIDSCKSGSAIPDLQDLCTTRPNCGLTIMTASDATSDAAAGVLLTDSATEDFLEGTGDLDGDGKSSDLGDHWRSMRDQGGGYNPQLYMCPGQSALCSTD